MNIPPKASAAKMLSTGMFPAAPFKVALQVAYQSFVTGRMHLCYGHVKSLLCPCNMCGTVARSERSLRGVCCRPVLRDVQACQLLLPTGP